MEHLPIEILRHICFMIKTDSPDTLPLLRLINRLWSDLVAPFLFETLRVKFRYLTGLQATASEVDKGRIGQLFLKYARKLDVVCLRGPYIQTKKARRLWQVKDWLMEFADYIPPAHRDTFLEHRLGECVDSDLRFLNSSVAYYSQVEWRPLVLLIARLERLEELNYAVRNMFPVSVDQVICQYHPRCRVNIWPFRTLSIDVPGLGRPDFESLLMNDPFEISILQSPSLHTFAVDYSTAHDHNGSRRPVHLDEILPFVCMGRNLKHLAIRNRTACLDDSIMKIKQEWKDFYADFKPIPAACLDSLSLDFGAAYGPLEEILVKLGNLVDLSRLRSLDMSVYSNPSLLTQAASLFHRLDRLFITMDAWAKCNEDVNADDEEMVAAVQAFAPVKFLCLRGLRSASSLGPILQHHGTSLQGLAIEVSDESRLLFSIPDLGYKYPVLDSQHISQLVDCCPNLQELRLQVKRRGGSPWECSIYRALSQFTQLHTLILDLHCDPRQSPIGSEDASIACLRETLINAATDESLAMSIWDLIASSQSSKRLKKLRIIPFGANFYSREEKHVIRQLSHSFLLTRPDFYSQRNPDVREIGKEAWELWREHDITENGRVHIPQQVEDLLHEIWPSTRGVPNKHWNDYWNSFPLQTDVL